MDKLFSTKVANSSPSTSTSKVYRSKTSGRFVSHKERVAAAKTRMVADRRRGLPTAPWIIELAKQAK